MHEHDTDLIMSLAQGELDDAGAARAEAAIAACDRCRSDLELQRSALEALAATRRAFLTAAESARLRNAVRDELRLKAPAPAVRPRRRRFPLAALAGAAAVLLAIVIAAPAFDLIGSDGDSSPATLDEALAPPRPTPALAPDETLPLASAPAPVPEGADEEQPPTLAATAADTTLRSFAADTDLEELRALVVEAGGPRAFLYEAAPEQPSTTLAPGDGTERDLEQVAPAAPAPIESSTRGALAPECDLAKVSGTDPATTPTVLGSMEYDGTPSVVVAYMGDTPTETRIVVIAVESCEVLASA